ncbi:heterokaryon incompatibility protein-domain-containing protein [Aspergillus avenaceus]|uniref:Heterokaryon incompatibility protein-domain-containing protein n=1 Tax=Aspergillus avenaceus TaxID=36643 RepID=A0A5N6U3Z8_ASPAV|nr:heterokaryon incompatibility protein-domain-containing protein [Aspergillus avenaceus]
MTLYKYRPLLEGHIRLLTLQPGGLDNPIITCSIEHVPLDGKPTFDALSYQWGVPEFNHQVNIHRESVSITPSLYNALLHLRLNDRPRTVWADAICINQQDREERSNQVLLMGRVYQLATRVVVYAGPATDQTLLGMELATQLEDYVDNTGDKADLELFDSEEKRLQEVGFPLSNDPAWAALRSLIRLTWSSRAWMIQESLLNRRTYLQYGTEHIDYETLPSLIHGSRSRRLPAAATLMEDETSSQERDKAIGNILLMGLLRKVIFSITSARQSPSLDLLLEWTKGFDCVDQRDRIYCLLGIASNNDHLNIKPEYDLSVREVYIDATVRMLRNSHCLDLLTSVAPKRLSCDLPSWVPDWSTARDLWELMHIPFLARQTLEPFDTFHDYRASADTLSDPEFNPDGTKLTLSAAFIDSVTYTTNEVAHNLDEEVYFRWLVNELWTLRQRSRYGKETFTALWRTLLVDKFHDQEVKLSFRAWWRIHKDIVLGNDITKESELELDRAKVFGRLISWHSCTRSFSTTKNRYFCLTPQNTQEGDSVVLLKGGRTPYIVRDDGRKYIFVGEAYVHGLMHGEAFEKDSGLDIKFERTTFV